MKKKLLKSASLVALSAVMMCGAAVSFAGCGDDSYTISISMFCGDSDTVVNQQNCDDWAKLYTQKLINDGVFSEEKGEAIKIKFSYQSNTESYFSTLSNQIASNSQPDVFYVSPKYVKLWSRLGKILDISSALAEDYETLKDVWEDSIAFYAYSKDSGYAQGDRIQYNTSTKRFETIKNGTPVGIYALPKDYSNFGLGFNEVFFTPEVREALTTRKTTARDNVKGAEGYAADVTYGADPGVITSDPEGTDDVALVNIGKPTWYRPYNFYRFDSYESALLQGDPMAAAVDYFTDGMGYCVTIPGFPGDTFAEAKAYWGENTNITIEGADTEVVYDAKQGYVTYTYAEYSALTWAVTYYLNTYDWQGNGKGGAMTATGVKNVYGNDQYDGVLYLLPWLAGNNVQYLNEDSTELESTAGNNTYKLGKKDIYGNTNQVDINWGINNPKFLEALGAFYAYGSDWNGNSNNAGDTAAEKSSGWDLFVAGNCVFYGVGTWNAGALNATDRQFLKYRLMPEPVSEDYALASYIKDGDYYMRGYGDIKVENGNMTNNAKDAYSGQEIVDNQITRQDKWGARMDSVGYGVSSLITDGASWRKDAAIDLVKYLTITKETQVTLTYAGSQLPNFKSQCNEFYDKTGDFADMVTPDDGAKWDAVYTVAQNMRKAAVSDSGNTVGNWLATNGKITVDGKEETVVYDTSFANTKLADLLDLSYAMKVLKMVAYKKADRDLSLRMQYGLNATRDSAMYTYNDNWLKALDARGTTYVMCYVQQRVYDGGATQIRSMLENLLRAGATGTPQAGASYGTPAWFYSFQLNNAKEALEAAKRTEKTLLGNR